MEPYANRHALLSLGLLLCGCEGAILEAPHPVGEPPKPPVPTTYNPQFACGGADALVPATMARLSKVQWVNSIEELFSTLSPDRLASAMGKLQADLNLLPSDSATDSAYSVNDGRLSQEHVDAVFEIAAALAADLAASDAHVRDLASVCGAGSTRQTLATSACRDAFVAHYARKALRRPATAAELADLKASYDRGLDFFLGRLLLHPGFYYRLDSEGEIQRGTAGVDALYRLSKYELLTKVTLLLWNRPPDDALYQFAANPAVDFTSDTGARELLERVLASPHAKAGVRLFAKEWLQLDKTPSFKDNHSLAFQTLAQGEAVDDPGRDHRQEMIEEVLALIEHYTFAPGGRFEDVLTSPFSFATGPALSKVYGVQPWNKDATHLVEFPREQPRSGLLTRAALLARDSEYTDPVHKGLRIRRRVLCDEIPAPDPTLFATFAKVQVDVNRTTRDDLESVITSHSSCAACHPSFTPLGYFTESYDSLGRFRTEETRFVQDANRSSTGTVAGKVPVNTQGVPLLFSGDREPLQNAIELGAHVAQSGKAHQCLVRQYFRYARGRTENVETDGCSLEAMRKALTTEGGGLLPMIQQTVLAPGFQSRQIQ